MDRPIYQYKCKQTGETYAYAIDKSQKSVENTDDMNTLKLEASCPHCGAKHALFIEPKKQAG